MFEKAKEEYEQDVEEGVHFSDFLIDEVMEASVNASPTQLVSLPTIKGLKEAIGEHPTDGTTQDVLIEALFNSVMSTIAEEGWK